ncbi:unnamed protein product [Owenia fusiformis]|uniref:Uncharacterized protein n=1 Tax=Owenia fusiformis TaxID=6347 RepID=A0A8J1Y0Q0_OWEFU|nr:unnamed protein product [Owenia fusiformis]
MVESLFTLGLNNIRLRRSLILEWAKLESRKDSMNNDVLKVLIDKKGGGINAVDQFGDNALMYAVRNNATKCAKLLLDHGANVNAVNNNGNTALMYAASVNSTVDCVKLLIAYGADINAKNNDGTTALIHAKPECMCILVDKGADVNAINRIGLTALMRASRFKNTAPMEALLRFFKRFFKEPRPAINHHTVSKALMISRPLKKR